MAVESIFDIICFKGVKSWEEQSVYIRVYRNHQKIKNHSPRVPAKAFTCKCVTIFYTLYGSGLLAQGGRCSAAQKPRA